jgi:molybdenum cofactor biosynthesis enzyme
MVDVGAKTALPRSQRRGHGQTTGGRGARAQAHRPSHEERPVFDTAIVAGVMAAKKTHEIVPFCHPLPLERCTVDISDRAGGTHPHRLQRRRASQDRRRDGSAVGASAAR